ncbi:MAG: MBL fold metallo-hydrolase, partial [Actinobacteria bacterium]|nr:MBL fold metallo-hydrolase [Actinomycetota bacterium]
MFTAWGDHARRLTEHVTVLSTPDNGAYPSGNSLLITGSSETVIIDPSVTIAAAGGVGLPVDAVINSHAHEDHMAGNSTFPDARVHIHADDLYGAHSIEGMLDGYGLVGQARDDFRETLLTEFHYSPRPDA